MPALTMRQLPERSGHGKQFLKELHDCDENFEYRGILIVFDSKTRGMVEENRFDAEVGR